MPNVSKAEAVRQYIADHPESKPQEVADALTAQDVEVSARYVSDIKFKSRRGARKAKEATSGNAARAAAGK